MMRLLFVTEVCSRGGVEIVLRNRLEVLRKNFPDIHADVFFLRDEGGRDIFKGFEENIFISDNLFSIKKFIKGGSYNFIFNIDNPSLYKLIKDIDQKVILEIHNPYENYLLYVKECYNKFINKERKNTIAFTVPSKYFEKVVLRDFGDNLPIYTFYNFVDESFILDINDKILKLKAHQKKTIGWAGRLDYLKDWKEFLRIAHGLIMERNDIEFLIVGGYGAPESEKNEFFNYLRKYHLLPHIRWLPSILYMPLFYKYLAESKGCFVSTSNRESFGMTMLESMICKCPVVGSNIEAFHELLDKGNRGNLYKKGDVDSGVQQINAILDDSPLRSRLVDNAYRAALEVYNPNKIMSNWVSFLYRKCL
jgi:glycosyltransferase involved in cell wall biosynthesis